jgi:hypothetical protein
VQQPVLRPEVPKERDFVHPRLLRNPAGGGAAETDFGEDGNGGQKDLSRTSIGGES